jgi:hypothetical protein
MTKSKEVLFATMVTSLAISIFVVIIITSNHVCHKWVGPLITGDDVAAIFTLCEGR